MAVGDVLEGNPTAGLQATADVGGHVQGLDCGQGWVAFVAKKREQSFAGVRDHGPPFRLGYKRVA
jgi:hypothetical protein